MIRRRKLVLSPGDVPASRPDLEVIGAFNPAAARVNGRVVLLVRVVERFADVPEGLRRLPRWWRGQIQGDDFSAGDLTEIDPRVVRPAGAAGLRLTFTSHLRVVTLDAAGEKVEEVTPFGLRPEGDAEEYGVEDPRATFIDGRWWVTYVAVSRHGPATALASTSDFRTFERHGIAFAPDNKDVCLFPEKVRDRYYAVHRPMGGAGFSRPEMWTASSPDLLHWGRHRFLYGGAREWEADRVGAGPPPVATERGWLLIYHGGRRSDRPGEVGEYASAALLLDRDDPNRIIGRSDEPFFVPAEPFERKGFVGGVVFPTALVESGPEWLVYYGAADTSVGVATLDRRELLMSL